MNRLASLFLAAALLAPLPAWAQTLLYAGSYTDQTSKGIYAWRFDGANGSLSPIGLVAEAAQPAHIWIAPNGEHLYSVNWEAVGGVSAYRINQKTGALTLLNRVSAHGALPNQIMLDPSGRIAVTVNYDGGSMAAYRVLPDGRLSDAFFVDQFSGDLGPNQPGSRAHGTEFSRDGRYLYAAVLGQDRVYAYEVDAARGQIRRGATPFVLTPPGSGPRRLQISPNGKFLYVNHQNDSKVSVLAANGTDLKVIQTVSTLPADFTGRNSTAEIIIDPRGRHLYVSNRGHNTIAVYDVDPATGLLTHKANNDSGGAIPRNLRLDPTGAWMLSANQNGNNISVLKVDQETGLLGPAAASVDINNPGGLYFVDTRNAELVQETWNLDNLSLIAGRKVTASGAPRIVDSPVGKALQFDGQDDSVLIENRPLVGASTFTAEVIFRPEGGQFQQRFLHIAETDPATGLDALPTGTQDPNPRYMFETRVVETGWYVDCFVNSRSGTQALIDRTKILPNNRWYSVAQTFDGKTYKCFVDGVLQAEAPIHYTPHGPGRVRAGARMNQIDHFTGSIARARFTNRALEPSQFLKVAN